MSRKELGILIRCCICTGTSIGLVSNCIGIFYTPLSESMGTGRGQVALIATIISVASALGGQAVPKLIKRLPMNIVMTIGACLAALGMFLLSFSRRLPVLYLIAVIIGMGVILYKNLTVSIVLRSWFGEKSASKLGIAMATSGAVAAVMNPILGKIIENGNYESGFRLLAALIAVLGIPAAYTIKLGDKGPAVSSGKAGAASETARTDIPAILMGLMFVLPLFLACACGMNTHFSSYAVTLGYSLGFGATLVAFQSAFNSIWKLVYGILADHIGVVRSGLVYLAGVGLASLLLIFITGSPAVITIAVSLYSMAFSVSTVCMPTLVQNVSHERYAEVYATVNMIHTLLYALFTVVFGTISDKAESYLPCLLIVLACTVLGSANCIAIARKAKLK